VRGNVVALERRLEDDTAPLWRAMADPTRRRILDLLRQRPLITGEIAAQFPISRIAVMRHLGQPTIDIALDIEIAGTPPAVFAALTKDIGGWWGHPFVTARATSLALDTRLGGLFTERWDNGGQLIASVTGWAQDEHLQLTGPFHLGIAVGVATFDLVGSGTGTLLRFSFRAIGVVDAALGEAMSRGWAELVRTRLKGLVETGTRLGIDPDEPPTVRSIR